LSSLTKIKERKRVVIHVDFDYFYAQCEELRNPKIKEKAVVVCVFTERAKDSGAVTTANYIARRYGVKSGMPLSKAKKLLKDADAVFLPVDDDYYEEKSKRIMRILRTYADKFEQESIDEAFLDVTKKVKGDFEKAKELALKIKKEIAEKEGITCSIGIGPNKLIAKMASGFQKPSGLTLIKPDEVKRFIFPLPVSKLYDVGSKTTEKLEEIGVKTIEDLSKLSLDTLTSLFGKKRGLYLHLASLGIDHDEVKDKQEAEQLSRITTLKRDTRDVNEIMKELEPLINDVFNMAEEQGLGFRSFSVITFLENLETHTRSRTFENPIGDINLVKKICKDLVAEIISSTNLMVRRIGFKVSSLTKKDGQRLISEYLK
jgi:DNA polymerase IV (DinB-like DNA polymerase)